MLNNPNTRQREINQIRLNCYRGDCTKSIEQVLIQDNVK